MVLLEKLCRSYLRLWNRSPDNTQDTQSGGQSLPRSLKPSTTKQSAVCQLDSNHKELLSNAPLQPSLRLEIFICFHLTHDIFPRPKGVRSTFWAREHPGRGWSHRPLRREDQRIMSGFPGRRSLTTYTPAVRVQSPMTGRRSASPRLASSPRER
jgi:hypothetical protein